MLRFIRFPLPLGTVAAVLASPALAQVHQFWPGSVDAVDSVGDIDGDGYDDVIVGRNQFDFANVLSGRDGSVIFNLPYAPVDTLNFGAMVAGVGDVNADGTPDFAVGGTGLYGSYSPSLVIIYSGADASRIHTYYASPLALGGSIAGVGDIDGDGHADVAVGSDGFQFDSVILSGATGGRLRHFPQGGRCIEQAGDVDGDGVADQVFASNDVWVRSGADGRVIYTYPIGWFHAHGAGIGDRDGDGFDDFAISGPSGLTLYSGATGMPTDTLADGGRARGVGDQNEDGVPDFLLCSSANGRLLSGADLGVLLDFPGHVWDCAPAGDANGDGRADFVYYVNDPDGAGVFLRSLGRFSYCGPAEPNSLGSRATLEATGELSLAADDFGLRASGLVPGRLGAFIASFQADFVPGFAGSDGNLCVGGPFGVFRSQAAPADAGGNLTIDVALPDLPGLGVLAPGDSVHFQCWYRDAAGRTNFTEGVKVYFN